MHKLCIMTWSIRRWKCDYSSDKYNNLHKLVLLFLEIHISPRHCKRTFTNDWSLYFFCSWFTVSHNCWFSPSVSQLVRTRRKMSTWPIKRDQESLTPGFHFAIDIDQTPFLSNTHRQWCPSLLHLPP